MKSAIAFALVGSAAAFAPVQQGRVNTAIAGDARSPDGLGVDPGPLDLFDPLGLVEDADSFPRRRAVEIKHGRIAMVSSRGRRARLGSSVDPRGLDRFVGRILIFDFILNFSCFFHLPSRPPSSV